MAETVTRYWRRILVSSAVYAAGGWAVVEALTTVVTRLGLPESLAALITALYLAGLPVTVLLVWRTAGEERRLTIPAFIGAMICLVIVTAAIFWVTRPQPAAPEQLIAVLPCEFAGDPAQAYRAEGIAEDVHARLSRVDAVKMLSWNSSLYARDEGYDTRRIAAVLDVDRIVKCHLNSTAERIELNTELLDTRAEEVLWSGDYDFVAADLGTVVTDLAGVLLDALGARASAAERERVDDLGTFSPEAYDLYLQARAAYQAMHWSREGGFDDLAGVERLLDEALRIDPDFVSALWGRAFAYMRRAHAMDFEDTGAIRALLDEARALSLHALDLDPGRGGFREILREVCEMGRVFFGDDCSVEEELRLIREECAVLGDTAAGWACRFSLMAETGEDNRPALERWLELEPTNISAHMQDMYFRSLSGGVSADVVSVLDTVHALAPDNRRPFGLISNLLRSEGRLDEVIAWRFRLFGDQRPTNWAHRMSRAATDYMNLGLYDEARALGEVAWETHRTTTLRFLPQLWTMLDEPDKAEAVLAWAVDALGAESARPLIRPAFDVAGLLRRFDWAEALYVRALAAADLPGLCEGEDYCIAWHALRLVQVKRALGKEDEAKQWMATAEAAFEREPSYLRGEDAAVRTRALEGVLRVVQGRHEEAVAALAEAIDAWEVPVGVWGFEDLAVPLYRLQSDAFFDPLRERSDFAAVLDRYRAYLEPMRLRVVRAEQTGDWEAIRRRTYELADLPAGDAARSPIRRQ
jgi:TolB-like protein